MKERKTKQGFWRDVELKFPNIQLYAIINTVEPPLSELRLTEVSVNRGNNEV